MFEISFGQWTVLVEADGLPNIYDSYVSHAALVEEFELKCSEGKLVFVAIKQGDSDLSTDRDWPEIVIAQRYEPFESGFNFGALVVPETSTLFIGAGTRLLAYDLSKPRRLWQDSTELGFWSRRQFGNTVLMSAELELAAWSADGKRLWSTFVEPPWGYAVDGERVELDVMGQQSSFQISVGPNKRGR